MKWQDHIEQNPEVMCGKPVIKGTRITVELILERLSSGWSEGELLCSFPHLNSEQIRAALAFASKAISYRDVIFLDEAG